MAPLLFHACARPISCICVSWKPATLAPPSKRSRFVRLLPLRDGKSYIFRAPPTLLPPSAICTHCCVWLHYATDESQIKQLSFRPYVATESRVQSRPPPGMWLAWEKRYVGYPHPTHWHWMLRPGAQDFCSYKSHTHTTWDTSVFRWPGFFTPIHSNYVIVPPSFSQILTMILLSFDLEGACKIFSRYQRSVSQDFRIRFITIQGLIYKETGRYWAKPYTQSLLQRNTSLSGAVSRWSQFIGQSIVDITWAARWSYKDLLVQPIQTTHPKITWVIFSK